ncbi:MAG: dihydroorotase [Planctomycetota bacterium]|jgi:dihydroorotase
MNDILITNGRVIDPASGLDDVGDVGIAKGVISKIAAPGKIPRKGKSVVDAAGKIVCPGLIDIHVHSREPGHEGEESIATAAAAAVAGGFTTICAMPNTHPPTDGETAVQYVLERATRANLARVLPVGCITKNREGKELAEMGSMADAGAIAFSDDGDGVGSTSIMHRALQYTGMINRPILQHCQDTDLMSGDMNSGATAVRLGLSGIAASGEEIMLRRDLELVERTDARYHVMHVSSAGSVELIRQGKAAGLPITAEATPHHLLLTDAACMGYDPNYKINPPLRSASDVEALRGGFADGTIDTLATDHAPHAKEEKDLEFALAPFGIISLDCAVALYAKALIETKVCDWVHLIAAMTANPARIIDSDAARLGRLAVGGVADVTIIDPNKRWTVRVDSFASRSRNCPYDGWKLKGRPVMTIVGGEVKFKL